MTTMVARPAGMPKAMANLYAAYPLTMDDVVGSDTVLTSAGNDE